MTRRVIRNFWGDFELASNVKPPQSKLHHGAVYWITGLSGSGKSTVALRLYQILQKENPGTVYLDGDRLREILGAATPDSYTPEERHLLAFTYAKLCKMLSEQKFTVICSTVSMLNDVREWNRKNINNYQEIYLKATEETLIARDQKNFIVEL